MGNQDLSESIKLLEKAKVQFEEICKTLETYERRVKFHSFAITELQDLLVADRKKINELTEKIERIEAKYGKDVMYQ